MREIKFRAWDKKEKRFINFEGKPIIEDMDSEGLIFFPDDNQLPHRGMHNKEFILMQFTGLKDKNGKEIYESDIIFWEDKPSYKYNSEIKFEDGCFLPICNLIRQKISFEVIGNIHENPELLEESK